MKFGLTWSVLWSMKFSILFIYISSMIFVKQTLSLSRGVYWLLVWRIWSQIRNEAKLNVLVWLNPKENWWASKTSVTVCSMAYQWQNGRLFSAEIAMVTWEATPTMSVTANCHSSLLVTYMQGTLIKSNKQNRDKLRAPNTF